MSKQPYTTSFRVVLWVSATVMVAGIGLRVPVSAQNQTPPAKPQQTKTQTAQPDAPSDPALERTRKQVKMLDDVYKGGIVLITTHYVNEATDLPAGTAFKKLFEAAKEKGWHEVRLLDASGEPLNDDNLPRDDFEKNAVKEMKKGGTWFEQVVTETAKDQATGEAKKPKQDQRFLRAATPIPVVMEKCLMCHENYRQAKQGAFIGALSYRIPIE